MSRQKVQSGHGHGNVGIERSTWYFSSEPGIIIVEI